MDGKRARIRVWLGLGHDKRTLVGRLVPAITFGRWAVHRSPAHDETYTYFLDYYTLAITHIPSGRQVWRFNRADLADALNIARWLVEHDHEYMSPAMLDADRDAAGIMDPLPGVAIVRAVCMAGIAPWYWAAWLTDHDAAAREAAASVRLDGETQAVS